MSPPAGGVAGYLRFPIRLAGGMAAIASMARAQALGLARAYPTTIAALGAIRGRMVEADRGRVWSGAEEVVRELVTAPTHSFVTAPDRAELLRLLLV